MGKLVVTEFITLDGVAEAPDKWIDGIHFKLFDEQGSKFKEDELASTGALLLGRVTYQAFAEAWPPRTGEFADRFNSMPKYVASRTLDKVDWNATLIRGDLADEVARLKRETGGDLVVHGSLQLVDSLTRLGLVDELRLWIDPIVVGTGRRLFKDGLDPTVLKLAGSKTFPSGTVVLIYHPGSAP